MWWMLLLILMNDSIKDDLLNTIQCFSEGICFKVIKKDLIRQDLT